PRCCDSEFADGYAFTRLAASSGNSIIYFGCWYFLNAALYRAIAKVELAKVLTALLARLINLSRSAISESASEEDFEDNVGGALTGRVGGGIWVSSDSNATSCCSQAILSSSLPRFGK